MHIRLKGKIPLPGIQKARTFLNFSLLGFLMKRISLLLLFISILKMASAQYKPLDQGSTLKFRIKNFGFDVPGTFSGFQGDITFDPLKVTDASFNVFVDSKSVNTSNTARDSHLKEAGYFDVAHYPEIRLVSTHISPGIKTGTYLFTGNLTMKGRSRTISFPFTAQPSGNGFDFKGSFKFNRKDYGIGGISTISSQLEVVLNVLAARS